jgi:uncharacterized protein (TIGR03435 family)
MKRLAGNHGSLQRGDHERVFSGLLRYFVLILLSGVLLSGQAVSNQVAFEIASVKRSPTSSGSRGIGVGLKVMDGRATIENLPLRMIIGTAFGLRIGESVRRVVGPDWLDLERYDINALLPEGATREQVPSMLEKLLQERFHFAGHREQRSLPCYDLLVVKRDRLRATDFTGKVANISNDSQGHHIVGPMPIENLIRWISRGVDRPVFDKTGLDGYFKIDLHWGDEKVGLELPSLYTALEQSLGLKLIPRKEMAEFVIVDRVDRVPTEN